MRAAFLTCPRLDRHCVAVCLLLHESKYGGVEFSISQSKISQMHNSAAWHFNINLLAVLPLSSGQKADVEIGRERESVRYLRLSIGKRLPQTVNGCRNIEIDACIIINIYEERKWDFSQQLVVYPSIKK